MNGYLPRRRTRELICAFPGLEPEEGAEPLRATVVSSLTFDQLDAIPNPIFKDDDDRLFYRHTRELREAIAPFVLAWNCLAIDRESGQPVPLPPPAESGPDILRAVAPEVAVWLGHELRLIHVSGRDPKETTPSGTTDVSSPPTATDAPASAPASRSSRGKSPRRRPASG